ncbi:MAG: cytochrome c-type biogenesis protein CcmH [Burkholderiales bacterium]|nr:cytochrome c-type biogenesis protein CcmH [Burkholderiales bacterium]MBK8667542.1 cytochrome c-type biogenesis protein CcmH [Burkholderiales bacterium]
MPEYAPLALTPSRALRTARSITLLLAATIALFFLSTAAVAREAAPIADDPALEARVMAIAEELRCLVCQNETIAASHAGLAVDLRAQIRERLAAGESAEQIRSFMVERYGNFVLYRPPLEPATWLLWIGPFVLLLAGLGVFAWLVQRRRRDAVPPTAAVAPLDDQRRRQLDRALREATEPRT